MTLAATVRFIRQHPLNATNPLGAYVRFLAWQLRSRLRRGPFTVPFVDDAKLVVDAGMTGLTGNIYCGLHEFEEMAFAMHFLRQEDLFVDVGANAGSYTVLAAAVAGASVIACEPDPDARRVLTRNIEANGCAGRVTVVTSAIGAREGRVEFSIGLDTTNHVLDGAERNTGREVSMQTLDAVLDGRASALIKIDVEGFEPEVVAGAERTLRDPAVLALITEVWPGHARNDRERNDVARRIEQFGFERVRYEPTTRAIRRDDRPPEAAVGNVIFVRDPGVVDSRVRAAPQRLVRATWTML